MKSYKECKGETASSGGSRRVRRERVMAMKVKVKDRQEMAKNRLRLLITQATAQCNGSAVPPEDSFFLFF